MARLHFILETTTMGRRLLTIAILIAVAFLGDIAFPDDKKPEAGKEKKPPEAVVFPKNGDYQHHGKLLTVPNGDNVNLRLAIKADDGDMFLVVEFAVEDYATKGKTPKLLDFGAFIFHGYYDDWQELNPKEILIKTEKGDFKLECKRADKALVGYFDLAEFSKLLSAASAQVKIAAHEFEFDESHLDGMRDLASRLPDGETRYGSFNVSHKDLAKAVPAKKRASAEVEKVVAELKKTKLEAFERRAKLIGSAKTELKQAMIADDTDAASKATRSIRQLKSEIRISIDSSIATDALDPFKIAEGQIGFLKDSRFSVLQVLKNSSGEALIQASYGNPRIMFKVVGVDLKNVVDGAKFQYREPFLVAGTYKYETVAGGTKTIFELHAVIVDAMFTDAESKRIQDVLDSDDTVILTADEQTQMKSAKEKNAIAASSKEAEAKIRRANSFVDSGKLLLKNDKIAGARKQFEKAIAEAPDSPAAKAAQKLLNELPQ